jgi:non-specific serine/threonine protein kinase
LTDVPFGEWLKRQRKASGLTQEQLADQVGCSTITIRKIEAEERRPSAQIVERLAHIFNIPKNEQENFLRFAHGSWKSGPSEVIEDVPWRVLSTVPRTNLPIPLTSFIGREKEIEEITRLVSKNRLVTLTGPGGVGKTRLAIQSSNKLLSKFKDGVWWVELAPLTDESLVTQAIAKALGLREIPNQSLNEAVSNFLHSKQLLLVLDNCEHLIAGCAQLADRLLSSCPTLKILATSREALGLISEDVWSVPILSLPNAQHMLLIDLLMQYEGIRLFVERASAAKPDFTLSERNALSVAQVCQRLDGMPLAIELAAARVKMMSVGEIAKRLDDRFDLLTAGSRTALPRHQTLRAAMDWSYDLLSGPERIFFSRLSVFAGGFTLDAAEEIAAGCDVSKSQVIDLLGQLINKSLVTVAARPENADAETRYGMLETIREYAREKLDEAAETEQLHQRHRDFFIAFAEQAEPKLKGTQQSEWLDRLEVEHDNLRAVLQWTQEVRDVGTTLRLAGTLFWFWVRRSYLSEGRGWLERALAAVEASVTTSVQAKALYEAAYLARAQGDFTGAQELVEQSVGKWRTLGSAGKQGQAHALVLLGNLTRDQGDPTTARSLIEESVALSREQGDSWGLASSLISLGMAIRDQEDYVLARSIIEESVPLWRELGDLWGLAEAFHNLALVAYRRGDYQAAYSLTEEELIIRCQLEDKRSIAYSLHNLGVFTLAQGDTNLARSFFEQDLVLFREVGDKSGIVLSLQYQGFFAQLEGDDVQAQSFFVEGLILAQETGPRWISGNYLLWLAGAAAGRDQLERAARLCGAAKAHSAASASFWDAFERAYYERVVALARASLGEEAFALAHAEGQALTLEQAVAYALD